jgi:hypothetical protein
MKNILTLAMLLLSSVLYSVLLTSVEINSEWNLKNSAKIDKVKNVEHRVTYLEDQTPSFKKKIKSVPLAILYKDNNAIARWDADISFKLIVTEDQILKAIKDNE